MQIDSHVHILRYLNAQNDVLAFVHHFLQLTDFCKQDKYIHTQYHFLHHQCIQLLESYLFHRGVLCFSSFFPQLGNAFSNSASWRAFSSSDQNLVLPA